MGVVERSVEDIDGLSSCERTVSCKTIYPLKIPLFSLLHKSCMGSFISRLKQTDVYQLKSNHRQKTKRKTRQSKGAMGCERDQCASIEKVATTKKN